MKDTILSKDIAVFTLSFQMKDTILSKDIAAFTHSFQMKDTILSKDFAVFTRSFQMTTFYTCGIHKCQPSTPAEGVTADDLYHSVSIPAEYTNRLQSHLAVPPFPATARWSNWWQSLGYEEGPL